MMCARQLWQSMLAQSFEPREWFDRQEWQDSPVTKQGRTNSEGLKMWVYKADGKSYEVGYFAPQGEWMADSTWATKEQAAERVHWLNGGSKG